MAKQARRRIPRGLFITLEGPEGSGKSTQIRSLATALEQEGHEVLVTREPGGTAVAEAIRHTLLTAASHEPITAETEALLILAARSQHVTHGIRPALQRGAIVLCDRFSDSTIAYQGFGRGLNQTWLRSANRIATSGLTPDLTLLLDLPVSVGLSRRQADRGGQNRLDRESRTFHETVRRGFLTLARKEPRRIKIIDADRPLTEVRADVEEIVLGWVTLRTRIRHR